MKATFSKTKDIGFDKKDGSGHLPGQQLTAMDGTVYKLWGNSSKNVSVGTEYEFEAADGKIDGKTFRPFGQSASVPEKDYEPPINKEKQSSIETQHAATCVTNLYIAGKIDDDCLLVKNLMPYLESKLLPGSHRSQMVQAAVDVGGVEKEGGVVAGPNIDAAQELALTLTTVGKLRLALGKLGLSTQETQLRAMGMDNFDDVKGFEGNCYMTAWEAVNGG